MNCRTRFVAVATTLACVALMLSALADAQSTGTTMQAAKVAMPGHVLAALADAKRVERGAKLGEASDDSLTLTVVLRRSDPEGFERYLADLYDPASPSFRSFATPQTVSDRFGPSAGEYAAVLAYFRQQRFELTEGSANRMTLTLKGTRASAERALDVRIGDYKLAERTFYANAGDPYLPADIAGRVEAVVGLSNLATPKPSLDYLPPNDLGRAVWYALCANYAVNGGISAYLGGPVAFFAIFEVELVYLSLLNSLINIAQASDLSSSGTGQQYAKCVNQFNARNGYSLLATNDPPAPAWQGADGTGQTVGLVQFDTFLMSDVQDYVNVMGHASGPISNVSRVRVNGGASPGSNQDEVLLDIANVLTGAPGAHVVVYDAPFSGANTSFQTVLNAMITGGVTIISNSWSYCEDQTTLADVQSIDTILQAAAASGISVFSGAGDHGSTCLDGSPNTAHVPASSPHITAVGGTSLKLYPGFTYGEEKWWDASADTPPGGQGGFGVSRFFARPAYQNGVSVAAMRSIPDVSANADPRFGVMICQASNGGCPSWKLYGGTSSSAPLWAAMAAMLNQTQGSNLGFFNALVYPLANTDAFHSAASMSSDFAHVGLGSPNLARLHQHLTHQTAGAPSSSVSLVRAFAQTTFTMPAGSTTPLPAYADGSNQTFIVVQLADANGNLLGGRTISLSANAGSHAVISPSIVNTDATTGVAIFYVTDTVAETVTITATDTTDGVTLDAQPKIGYVAQPAASGSITANPNMVPPDGTTTTTITVILQDAQSHGSPGKVVQLAQGAGHSVITGPNPATTDANGQVQFTATDGVNETVVYTAIDVTDANLAIPGSASVSFTGTATSCVPAAPVAGSGFALAPWATGFVARNFFFGNVNWGGCGGASNPTFSGPAAYIADFPTGDLYKLTLAGGAVSTSNRLSSLGLTLGQPVIAPNGRLYATHGATTGNFTTGDIVELDPATGAQIRVVVANLTCPNGLAVDPLSGDLFFDDDCFGAGSDDPSVWRIHDPAGAAIKTVYASLPASPGGQLAFAPDGTLYAVSNYTAAPGPVVRISGTNLAQPASVTVVPNLFSYFSLTLGQAQPNGAAKAFIVPDPAGVELVDITTAPYTRTILASGGGSGAIGSDGCLYIPANDTIFKLTTAAGGCGFVPTSPVPTLILSPSSAVPGPAQGSTQTFSATFNNIAVPIGTPVTFTIDGANAQLKLANTDSTGTATIAYVGRATGTDTVTTTSRVASSQYTSNTGSVTWSAGRHVSFASLDQSPAGGSAGQTVTLVGSLADVTPNPFVGIAGATLQFTLAGQACSGTTDGNGRASCNVVLRTPGSLTLTVSYAGSAAGTPQYTAASALRTFFVSPVSAVGSVYSPTTPCRIVDTRNAGGPIAAGTSRQFYFYNDQAGFSWAAQGGVPGLAATACPGSTLTSAGGSLGNLAPEAAVITITDVNATAAGNFIVWGGGNPIPTASALNWNGAGVVVANSTLVPGGGRNGTLDFEVQVNGPSGQADFVADVVGYVYPSTATALQCAVQSNPGTGAHNPGTSFKLTFPTCDLGYTATNYGCMNSAALPADVYLQEISPMATRCAWYNATGAPVNAATYRAESVCCRVPGAN